MYGCERWTIKKAECQRIDTFELWCWRRFLRVPWTARRSNQSIWKEINPEYSLEGLMLKLKFQNFGHNVKSWLIGKEKAGEGDNRGWDGWMTSLTQWTWVWANSRRWWRTTKPGVLQSMGSQRVGHDWVTKQFILKRFILYWSIVNYQCCDGFRWTAKGLSHTCTCNHSPPNSPPIQIAT